MGGVQIFSAQTNAVDLDGLSIAVARWKEWVFKMKLISVVSPCYNEEGNIELLTDRVREIFAVMPQYRYEHIIIDNHSTDGTVEKLIVIAAKDKNVKVIINARNLAHIRSPDHAIMEAKGAAVIMLRSDRQSPPERLY